MQGYVFAITPNHQSYKCSNKKSGERQLTFTKHILRIIYTKISIQNGYMLSSQLKKENGTYER
jgi:hypothetical protein